MRRPLTAAVAAAAVLLAAAPSSGARATSASAAPGTKPWATVNACDPAGTPGRVGVRAYVPLRGTAAQWLRVRLQSWDATAGRWRWAPGGDGGWSKVGRGRTGRYGGANFDLWPLPAAGSRYLMRGVADIEWRSSGKVVARARVRTTAGHRNAKDRALRISQKTCEIRR